MSNTTLVSAQLFDDWIARAWRDLRRVFTPRAADPAERAAREAREAAEALRDRIARYEREQPGYAADLRAALAHAERDLAERRR
ncbi:MAG TPA: hypothetical protein VM845_12470 [Burkholderiaceae bacterium]|jgi:hypothetical protein|nr:hypothetical protein [Burkholderiaceae bacterium]